jgi:hypothetical protein
VVEPDFGMGVFQLPLFCVDLHGGMAATAGKHPLGEGGERDGKFFTGLFRTGRSSRRRFPSLRDRRG